MLELFSKAKTWQTELGFKEDFTQADVADFNLAVTLVAPWEEYVIDLSPDFQLKTGEDALKRAIPMTGTLEEKILNSFGASAKLNVDVSALAAALASAHDSGGSAEEPHEAAHKGGKNAEANKLGEQKSGTSVSGKGAAGPNEESESSKKSHASKGGQAVGMDPMLEYAAATAFFQEVKLLNRYVADAALRRDYRAYVVRLQMSIVPYVRHVPLDIYTNISFFPRRENVKGGGPGDSISYPAEVVPLLVTDNLENTIKSRSLDSIRNLALALSFLHPGIGGATGSLESRHRDFAHALGGDLNSLLTIGRVSDNTLQIRLGAVKDIACPFEYAMLPRTHNVSILLMVPSEFINEEPDKVCRITAVSKTQLREALTGKVLPAQTSAGRRKLVEDLVRAEIQDKDVSRVAETLLRSVFRNDFDRFEETLKNARKHDDQSNPYANPLDLWCRIVETFGKSDFAAVRFELPLSAQLPGDDSALAVDDGTHTTIHLQGGSGLNQNGVSATLFVMTDAGDVPLVPISDPPGNEIRIMAGGHGMTITFPSLASWNLVEEAKDVRSGRITLRLRYAEGRKWSRETHDEAEKKRVERSYNKIFYLKVKPTAAAPEGAQAGKNGPPKKKVPPKQEKNN